MLIHREPYGALQRFDCVKYLDCFEFKKCDDTDSLHRRIHEFEPTKLYNIIK